MKKLFVGLLALGSFSSFAMSTNIFLDQITGELSYLITGPAHNGSGMPFSYYSNETGVCKALGYERAAYGSGRHTDKADTIKVSSSGSVISGPYDNVLKQIVCLDKNH